MALFPSGDVETSSKEQDTTTNWLHNPSFDSTVVAELSPPPPHPRPVKQVISTPQKQVAPPQDGFKVDPTPDRDNLSYDSLYSGNVSSYRRKYSVIGLNRGQSVLLDDGRGHAKSKGRREEKPVRYFKNVPIKCSQVVSARPSSASDSLGDVVLLGESVAESPESYNRSRTAQFNKALSSDPGNVSLWLEFIREQDSLCEGVKEAAMNERKMAIYEEALSSNSRNVELLLGHMKLMPSVRDSKAVLQRWKELIFTHPNVPQLWLGYVQYCQEDFAHFSTDSVIAVYTKCLSTLSRINEGLLQSHSPLPDSQRWTLTIFQHYCQFLKSSGYVERGVASYQALLELNLCTPPHLTKAPLGRVVTELRDHWETGSPRLGESSARGWSDQSLGQVFDVKMSFDPPPEEDDVDLVSGLSEKEAWLRLENERWAWHILPWREEEEPLDGERIVTFEAVQSVLFRVDSDELKLALVMDFLRFLGALTPSHTLTLTHTHTHTPSQSKNHTSLLEDLTQLSSNLVALFSRLLGDNFTPSSPVSPLPLVCENIGQLVDCLSDVMLGESPSPTHPLLLGTICRLCQQCLSLLSSECAQTVLGLTWTANALKAALVNPVFKKLPQRVIKNLLKTHRQNMELWRCCALVEHSLGRDCFSVFVTLLSSSVTPQLVSTLVEVSLTTSTDHKLALNALLSLGEGSFSPDNPVTPTRILKANFACSDDASPVNVLHTGLCRAYFAYLTKGLSPACAVLDQLAPSLSHQNALTLRLCQVKLCLLSPRTEPRYLRGVLDSGLSLSPSHPWLLANRILTEEQAFSVGRLARDNPSPEGRLFALLQELRRLERVKSVSGSSAGGLRRALGLLESAVGTHPLLWRLYLMLQALVDQSQLKTLFYRAIHACPWSKCLYMEGARLLPTDQLQTVLEVMEEKGIRVHTPLEEVQLLLVN